MEHFQKIISLNRFILFFGFPVIILVIWYMSKQKLLSVTKEKIAFGLFLGFLLPTISVSVASYINRNFQKNFNQEQVEVTEVEPSFNFMYGITYDEMNNKIPSHYRIYFDFNKQEYNRSFKKNPCLEDLDQPSSCFIVINNGGLGFDVINLNNK